MAIAWKTFVPVLVGLVAAGVGAGGGFVISTVIWRGDVSALQQERDTLAGKNSSLTKERLGLQAALTTSRRVLKEKTKAMARAADDAETARKELELQIQGLRGELEQATKTLKQLRADTIKERQTLIDERTELQTQMATLRKENEVLKKRLADKGQSPAVP